MHRCWKSVLMHSECVCMYICIYTEGGAEVWDHSPIRDEHVRPHCTCVCMCRVRLGEDDEWRWMCSTHKTLACRRIRTPGESICYFLAFWTRTTWANFLTPNPISPEHRDLPVHDLKVLSRFLNSVPLSYGGRFKLAAGSTEKKKFYVVTLWAECENRGLRLCRQRRCNQSLAHLPPRERQLEPPLVHMDALDIYTLHTDGHTRLWLYLQLIFIIYGLYNIIQCSICTCTVLTTILYSFGTLYI